MTHSNTHTGSTTRPQSRAVVSGLASALLVLTSGAPALADDTEILTGQIGDYAAPNILFVIDTSGSMDGDVLIDDSYDPTFDYPGPYSDESRVYYVLTDASGDFFYPDADYAAFGLYVNRSALVCAAGNTALATSGRFIDRIAQFNPATNTWGALEGENGDPLLNGVDRLTECFADDGSHGLTEGAPEVYPVDGEIDVTTGVPWSADENADGRFQWRSYPLRYVFFENNYLNWIDFSAAGSTPVVRTRLEIVQEVTTNLLNDLTSSDLDPLQAYNVGLMRFSTTGDGGMVLQRVDNVIQTQEDVATAITSLTASNNTPLAETIYEAYQYYRGGTVTYGLTSQPQLSASDSYSAGAYTSPITASCQKNYVVLLTDGLPTSDTGANDAIASLIGRECVGNCLDDLTTFMAQADARPTLSDVQEVDTFVIGFFTDSDFLRNAATAEIENEDGSVTPGYFLANNVSELEGAFDTILDGVGSAVATFTSPAVSVNSLNRLQNRDVLYFTLFRPASSGQPHWDGNLKAYYLGRPAGDDPDVDNADLEILDANRLPAIDDNGNFRTSAKSIWSENPDGGVVAEGGFISRLSTNRRVVTNVAGADLFATDNTIAETNSQITAQDLGLVVPPDPDGAAAAETRRLELLRYASGLDENGQPTRIIGDPLHTQPLIVSYSGGAEDLRLFFSTNDGFLHAIDPTPTTGSIDDLEEFAFIPKELLPNLDAIERNEPALPNVAQKMYGLDGPLTSYVVGDTNFVVDPDERMYIYSAMRRGGNSYYALDLGTGGRSDPRLAFQIERGDAGFAKLGQTWSAAEPTTVDIGGGDIDVLIFGGGYDTSHDSTYSTNEGTGNAIYMVDATDGTLIWSASSSGATLNLPNMLFSIPSDITVLDINQDGLSDRMYVGDMGGQVWRFDIGTEGITGARLAALGGSGSSEERRFFNAPRVARILTEDQNFLTIAIGSGWRSHPLATENQDRLYMLKDPNVFTPPVDSNGDIEYPTTLTNDDLIAITLDSPPDAAAIRGAGGWYLTLPNSGEKNLSSALLADNRVFFTTYAPTGGTVSCVPTPVTGVGRLYGLDILTGLPALFNTDGSGDGFIVLDAAGIPPGVQSVFVEPACDMNCDDPDPDDPDPALPITSTNNGLCRGVSEHTLMVGFQEISVGVCTEPRRTYWSEADAPLEEL